MPVPPGDDRPPMAIAMQWVSRITTISMTMGLPPLAGSWLDQKWGIAPWLTVVGGVIGFLAAMAQLLQLAKDSGSRKPPSAGES